MTGRIRFALVGCGAISRKHLAAIDLVEDAELAAVCDISRQAAEQVGEARNVPWFTDPHQMAHEVEFDVFTILAPSGAHAGLILDLIKHGHHFVVEKPMSLLMEEADEIIRACDVSALKVFVVQQNRFNKPIRKLHETVMSGRLGKPVLGTVRVRWKRDQNYYDAKSWRGTWEHDGGVITNQASHHVDMLAWLMGEVESVMAMTARRLADIEAEDTAVAILRFSSGALGIIEATTGTRPKDLEGSLSLLCERGSAEVGGFFMNELKTWNMSEPIPDDETVFQDWGSNPDVFAWNHGENLRNIVEAIRSGRAGLIEGIEGRRSLELINAIYESAETGKLVPLRFRPKVSRLGRPEAS